ncbi:beta-galactosidase trimerization domain-containing protein [Cognataquiflexum rubidum]|uniref:beta-galactosidase trimerization domain-containing protein n=1 Tax=Cognataquiflexum rubidum TaxID=2922273 RepID=UPI001F13D496|nr:beta-galactosidase trimerization domain-containing protein [Cognataquiflexum rubidum]MCH6233156.1 beta-galactosidase trimerization domain-containing protein [Cognataquiflexum rubidum]
MKNNEIRIPDVSEGSKEFGLSRRNFIQLGSVVAGGMILSPSFAAANIYNKSNKPVDPQWYHKPVRIMHTVLREIDARNYNAAKVVEYLKKGSYNTLCVNAGGIVDFFQNPLSAGNINKEMGDRDVLREISEACHKEGIKVIARIDFRGVEEHIYQKFPDWFIKDINGEPVKLTYTKPQLYASCYLGKHRNDYANDYVSYVLKNYKVDGIWHNSPGFNGICYCKPCRESFHKFSGKSLPGRQAPPEEISEYMVWKRIEADGYMKRIKNTVKSFGDDKVYTAEIFSIYDVGQNLDWGLGFDNARDHFDILVSVAFLTGHGADKYYFDLNYGTTIIKFLKSMVPDREAVVMYGGNGTSHRLVADPSIDLKIWLWQILSVGGRFWNCYFTNVPTLSHDNRNAYNETEAYNFVKENEVLLEQHIPHSNIGIYYSNSTRESYRKKAEDEDAYGNEIRGIETVLMENHIPHDFLIDDHFSEEKFQKYKLIILPNVKCISKKEVTLFKKFVENGGNLIATYASSLFDEKGNELENYGLSEVLGVNYAGKRVNTKSDNYQFILDKGHPLVSADSSETELLFNAAHTTLCKPMPNTKVVCTWVPTIQNQPPDKSWVEDFSTEYPTITENEYGEGKVIYFANQPDLISHVIGHADPRNLLARAIQYLVGNQIPLDTNAPPSVNLGLTTSLIHPGQYILSLVNTTSGPIRPIRALIPVHDIWIKVNLPGEKLLDHKVLRCQGDCVVNKFGEGLEIKISKLQDYFSLHFTMG